MLIHTFMSVMLRLGGGERGMISQKKNEAG